MLSPDLDYLYSLYREGTKLDLSVTRDFAERLGNPHESFRSFHITGTNGKGSTSSYIYNVLSKKFRTGLYTSPHLIRFNERIVLGREQITDLEIAEFISEHRDLISNLARERRNPTFFEATTVLAFNHFARGGAQFASIEVGLGGRLDSTNIIKPEISVITQVGYEHADKLGCSLTSIAGEKAGIIKKGVPVVLGDQKREVVETVRKYAESRDSKLLQTQEATEISDLNQSLEGSTFTLSTPKRQYSIKTSMIGRFQPQNIATAVLAIENSGVTGITKRDVESGIRNSKWPGRVQVIRRDPTVIVDGAHNPPAANALRISLGDIGVKSPTMVIGMLSDKDHYSFLRIARRISGNVIFTTPDEPSRAYPAAKLKTVSEGIFKDPVVIEDPMEAYETAIENSENVLVTGSLYLVGAVINHDKVAVMPYLKD